MTSSILWRRLDLPGHEIGRLFLGRDHRELSGTAVFSHERQPCRLDYFVACDSGWQTSSAHVGGLIGERDLDLSVSVDTERRWYVNGTELPALAGCIDIDLGFSPATNLLPIRRLSLDVGEEAEVNAAWLTFPSLAFEVLPQTYRRSMTPMPFTTDGVDRSKSAGRREMKNGEAEPSASAIHSATFCTSSDHSSSSVGGQAHHHVRTIDAAERGR